MDKKVLIIGAGVAGLTAARKLRQKGFIVEVIDKGRGIGGRLASRRIHTERVGESTFDYGAQFFTARNPEFIKLKDELIKKNVAKVWAETLPGVRKKTNEENPYYCGIKSMRSICNYLASDILVHTSTKIIKIIYDKKWISIADDGRQFEGDYLLMTQPVPQILELFDKSEIPVDNLLRSRLEKINYDPCIAVLAVLNGFSKINSPGGIKLPGEPVSFIADNKIKGISKNVSAITIHTGPQYSRTNWDKSNEQIIKEIYESVKEHLGSEIIDYQIHRWKYSLAKTLYEKPSAIIKKPGILILAGDAFAAPKIEGAFISGLSAADRLISEVNIN